MNTLCFDIGGSKYRVGVISEQGEVFCSGQYAWDTLTADGVLRSLVASGKALLRENPSCLPDVIGVTVPGVTDPGTGVWVEASFSGIRDFPVGRLLHEAFSLPVYAENDAKACALAEKLYGAAKDTDHFLYLTVSNGVGGAVFSDGRLLYGTGAAGECGHVTVVEDGRPCKCGKNGCLEMYAAGPGLARTYTEKTGEAQGGEEIARRARQGDAAALETFRLEGMYLGRMIGMAVNLLSPRRVIVGGGLSLAFDLYREELRKTVQSHIYRAANPEMDVVPSPLGARGGLYGAAATAVCGILRLYGYKGKAV